MQVSFIDLGKILARACMINREIFHDSCFTFLQGSCKIPTHDLARTLDIFLARICQVFLIGLCLNYPSASLPNTVVLGDLDILYFVLSSYGVTVSV